MMDNKAAAADITSDHGRRQPTNKQGMSADRHGRPRTIACGGDGGALQHKAEELSESVLPGARVMVDSRRLPTVGLGSNFSRFQSWTGIGSKLLWMSCKLTFEVNQQCSTPPDPIAARIIIIIIIIRNLYSAIMPLGGYRGAEWSGKGQKKGKAQSEV